MIGNIAGTVKWLLKLGKEGKRSRVTGNQLIMPVREPTVEPLLSSQRF